jgi:hypothetical protein
MTGSRLSLLALFPLLLSGRVIEAQRVPVLDTVLARRCAAVCDTVRGMAFDSLSGGPLSGATVIARPSGQVWATDTLGRFELVDDRRIESVLVYHAELDRNGIGALYAERPGAQQR